MENYEQVLKMPVKELTEKLEKKEIEPNLLSGNLRLKCIIFYTSRGYTPTEIADILQMSDRHIRRQLLKWRNENEVDIDTDWLSRIILDVLNHYKMDRAFLLKQSYDENAPLAERSQARYLAWRVSREALQTIHAVGGFNDIDIFTLVDSLKTKYDKNHKPNNVPVTKEFILNILKENLKEEIKRKKEVDEILKKISDCLKDKV